MLVTRDEGLRTVLVTRDEGLRTVLGLSSGQKLQYSSSQLTKRDIYWNVWSSIEKSINVNGSNRKAMNRNWSNQKPNPALKTKMGIK